MPLWAATMPRSWAGSAAKSWCRSSCSSFWTTPATTCCSAQDYDEAFRAAHTIKGVCQNLGFTLLYRSSAALCEALRSGFHPEAPALAETVAADYAQTTDAIRAFRDAAGL